VTIDGIFYLEKVINILLICMLFISFIDFAGIFGILFRIMYLMLYDRSK